MTGYRARGQPHAVGVGGHRPVGIGSLCPDSSGGSNPGGAGVWGTAPLAVSAAGDLAWRGKGETQWGLAVCGTSERAGPGPGSTEAAFPACLWV